MSWGLRGQVSKAFERAGATVETILPERASIAFAAIRRHKRRVGVFPNLLHPMTFNEKVLHRMIFDRRPILTTLQDKYVSRQYVKDRIGDDTLPRLYWVTRNPADIPFDRLPDRFVVKATHGCGFNYLVRDKARVKTSEVAARCTMWLRSNFYTVNREWVYKHIEPQIIIEEFIDDGIGPDPIRYKFYTFHGGVRAIYVGVGSPGQARCAFYDRSWNRLSATLSRKVQIEKELVRPKHLDEMIRYSEILGQGLDFIRVDLYDTPPQAYFGEFTIIPGAGTEPFQPFEFDYHLGALWGDRSKHSYASSASISGPQIESRSQ